MATAVLRVESITQVPDPLRSQLRTLAAVAGTGRRFVVVPAALIYRRPVARPEGRTIYATPGAVGSAELSIVLVRSEERRVGKSVDLGGRRIIKKKKCRIAAGDGATKKSEVNT